MASQTHAQAVAGPLALAQKHVVEAAKVWARTNDAFAVPMDEVVKARTYLKDAVERLERMERGV